MPGLPRGFQKVRHYGFASARRRKNFEHIRWLVTLAMGLTYLLTPRPPTLEKTTTIVICDQCGGPLRIVAVRHSTTFRDTS